MWSFGAFCDDYSVMSRMYFKLQLEPSRETVLHFFEQLRKAYPRLGKLRTRENGGLILDEDAPDGAPRRFVRLDPSSLKFGTYAPPDQDAVLQFGKLVYSGAPAHLSLSDLDVDYLEVAFAFDLEYRGNHDELIAETFFANHPLTNTLAGDRTTVIDCQPFLGVTVTADCERQLTVEFKARTSTFELRSGEYEASAITVYLTVRQYWTNAGINELVRLHGELVRTGSRYAEERVLPNIVQPLAAAIASRR